MGRMSRGAGGEGPKPRWIKINVEVFVCQFKGFTWADQIRLSWKRRNIERCPLVKPTERLPWWESGMQHLHRDPNLCPLCTLPYITCKARRTDVCWCVVEVRMRNTVMCFCSFVADNDNTAPDPSIWMFLRNDDIKKMFIAWTSRRYLADKHSQTPRTAQMLLWHIFFVFVTGKKGAYTLK